jgi:hypothetical protein
MFLYHFDLTTSGFWLFLALFRLLEVHMKVSLADLSEHEVSVDAKGRLTNGNVHCAVVQIRKE